MKKNLLYTLLAFLFALQASAQNKASYTYDANNQLTQVVYANGTTVKYTYDALGNRLSKKVTTVQQQYTITLTASPVEGGKVTGAGTYYDGTTVTIKATANEGYAFSRWSDGDTNASRTIVANKNYSLTAYFEQVTEPENPGGSDDLSQPTGTTLDATDIGETSATLRANINTTGIYSAWAFQYGKTTSYGESTSIRTIAAGLEGAYQYNFTVANLEPNTTYHYRVLVTLTGGQTLYGQDMTFTTTGAPVEQDGILGDVNNDGVVNKEDIRQIKHAYIGIDVDTSRCDVDNDGKISVADVAIVIAIANGTYNGGDENPPFDGDEYVDLGLPSGTLWATCNLGANSPEKPGDFYLWGETVPVNSRTGDYFDSTKSKYNNSALTELKPEDDAAYVNLGNNWRIPSVEQFKELSDNCVWEAVYSNYIKGTGPNGNTIILPYPGTYRDPKYENSYPPVAASFVYYWTRNLSNNDDNAQYVYIDGYSGSTRDEDYYVVYLTNTQTNRENCQAIRPVYVNTTTEPEPEPEVSSDLSFSTAPYIWSDSKVEVKEMVKGNTYKVYYKYKNYGSEIWEGNLYLLANSDTIKVWTNRNYDPEHGASINATYTPQTTGTVRFTLYCKPTGSKNSMLVAEGLFSSNPMYAEVVDPAPANGTYRGYSYVNLGLPSGTLWASYNVGASKPEGTGNHYAWGETVGCDVKAEYQPRNYKYYDYDTDRYTKYWVDVDEEAIHGITDNLKKLLPEDDAATANWGGNWRMPIEKERDELMNAAYTKWTLTTVNGVVGYKVESLMSGYEGNFIFLPFAGYCQGTKRDYKAGERGDYLTAALDASYPSGARFLYLTTDTVGLGSTSRYKGSSVRAVVSAGGIK